MPRVTNPPRSNLGAATTKQNASPLKIPLNDDRQEKAIRFQSRQALHDIQLNQIKAAASPMRKLNNYDRAASSSPKTPQIQRGRGKENFNDDAMLAVKPGNSMTPLKRVPILANFEEWMKMATDNKINATNSWNFALIDYFHDMSLLKEGDGVNFQKASCTLDGCVKIYTSRVDSVATETGKLLSGLADSGNKKQKRGEEEDGQDEAGGGDEEGEDGSRKKQKKKRSSETTLAPSFASLQLKKFELEFSVDPLFKKASADFDEGGAKGLLLNHLAIDEQGRIVFDSSNDAEAGANHADERQGPTENAPTAQPDHKATRDSSQTGSDINIDALRSLFFPDLAVLDSQDVCPSLKNFDLADPGATLDVPLLKDTESSDVDGGAVGQHDGDGPAFGREAADMMDDDDGFLGGFEMPRDTGFGDGGEVWAKDTALEAPLRIYNGAFDEDGQAYEDGTPRGDFDINGGAYAVSLAHQRTWAHQDNVLSYFDNTLKKNWAGPEHWRIRRIKDVSKMQSSTPPKRKEKEPFEIDFSSALEPSLAELIHTSATSSSVISLPKTQWKAKSRNLLPDDTHFNSRQLLRLFLKPRARMGSRKQVRGAPTINRVSESDMDEAYWARQDATRTQELSEETIAQGGYDANFFQDDGLAFAGGLPDDDDDFADAREAFSPDEGLRAAASHTIDGALLGMPDDQAGAFGSQLVTQSKRIRPEYVQYARVAKKVDVRRLKEEMWRGIGLDNVIDAQPSTETSQSPSSDPTPQSQQFTSVINGLQEVYPKQAMADISTSYCFICLLHLANEKGLELHNGIDLEELSIKKDLRAEISEVF